MNQTYNSESSIIEVKTSDKTKLLENANKSWIKLDWDNPDSFPDERFIGKYILLWDASEDFAYIHIFSHYAIECLKGEDYSEHYAHVTHWKFVGEPEDKITEIAPLED